MGLDISAYSRCLFVHGESEQTDACYDLDHIHVYPAAEAFVSRLDGRQVGCYVSDGAQVGFRADSYGGYNAWRAELCRLVLGVEPEMVWADPVSYADRPFISLINFADNEGAIGPETSARLYADFLRHTHLSAALGQRFTEWTDAFRIAADHGFVVFH
jgi:hypothetical protein